jgi:hypothetical protein
MFRSTTIIRKLVLSLAKVILKHSVKYVVIYYVVQYSAQHTTNKSLQDVLLHHHIIYNDVFYRVF